MAHLALTDSNHRASLKSGHAAFPPFGAGTYKAVVGVGHSDARAHPLLSVAHTATYAIRDTQMNHALPFA